MVTDAVTDEDGAFVVVVIDNAADDNCEGDDATVTNAVRDAVTDEDDAEAVVAIDDDDDDDDCEGDDPVVNDAVTVADGAEAVIALDGGDDDISVVCNSGFPGCGCKIKTSE